MRNGDSCLYHSHLFPLRPDGSVSGSTARNGPLRCPHDPVDHWNRRAPDRMDIRNFPGTQIIEGTVYFLPGILDFYDRYAGDLFLVCKTEGTQAAFGRKCIIKIMSRISEKADIVPLFCIYRENKISWFGVCSWTADNAYSLKIKFIT